MLTAGIQKSREILKSLRLLEGRTGEILDMTSLGNDAGVDSISRINSLTILQNKCSIPSAAENSGEN